MTGDAYDIGSVLDTHDGDPLVAHGGALLRFVDAVLSAGDDELAAARIAVREAVGPAAFVDTCATVASFNAVVKLADGSGVPLEEEKAERTASLREEFGLDSWHKE